MRSFIISYRVLSIKKQISSPKNPDFMDLTTLYEILNKAEVRRSNRISRFWVNFSEITVHFKNLPVELRCK